jgi:fructokinase
MSKPNIICFGEVLWDMLPPEFGGKKPGGAPMNVAFHVQQLGSSTKMISSIGKDALGEELLQFIDNEGINSQLIQRTNDFPTSTVQVTLDEKGSPSYEIVENVAWDNIQLSNEILNEVTETDAVVFGSLACRNDRSRNTLFELLEVVNLRIFDVNLRPPFYSKSLLEKLLNYADIVKMNEAEMNIIAAWNHAIADELSMMTFIKNHYNIDIIIVTKGSNGVICMENDTIISHQGFPIKVKDTIGSGDAFLAGFIHQFLKGENTASCLELASAMGAIISTKTGATPKVTTTELEQIKTQKTLTFY